MKSMLKDAGILFLITLISGLFLGLVYQVTKDPIAIQEEKARMAARKEVFQDADHFEDGQGFTEESAREVLDGGGFTEAGINEYAAALDKDGKVLGYVITVTTYEGYGGGNKFFNRGGGGRPPNGKVILFIFQTPRPGRKREGGIKTQVCREKGGRQVD